jgi:hypothetical protein
VAKGKVKQRTYYEDGKLYNVWVQPDRAEMLNANAERRKVNPRKSDWIRPAASIPTVDREVLKKKRPEIFEDRRKLERFLNSADGMKYRTTPRGRSRNISFGGI